MADHDFQVFAQLVPASATIEGLQKQVQQYFDKNKIKVKFENIDVGDGVAKATKNATQQLLNRIATLQTTFGGNYFKTQENILNRLGLSGADIKAAKTALDDLNTAYAQFQTAASGSDLNLKKSAVADLTATYQKFSSTLKDVKIEAARASQSVKFDQLSTRAKSYFEQFESGIRKNTLLSQQWNELLVKIGSQDAWGSSNQAKAALDNLIRKSQQAGVEVASLGQIMRDVFGDHIYMAAMSQLSSLASLALNQLLSNVVDLDGAMTDLQIASGLTRSELKLLMKDYGELAQRIGATTLEVSQAADGWLRQGYTMEETSGLIESSMMLSKLGQISSEEATTALTSALKGYKLEANDATDVVSKLVAVDMEAAASAGGLATAMSKTATLADQTGISMDRLIGIIATIMDVTQDSAESVGVAVKSMLARLGNIQAGRLIDPETSEDLSQVETVLKNIGVALRTSPSDWRDYQDVLDDIAAKWDTLSETQQRAVAVALGQTRRQEQFLVLMSNYQKVREFTETAASSSGLAPEKYANYMGSIEAKLNSLRAAWESLSQSVISSNLVTGGLQFITDLVSGLNNLIDRVGALSTLGAALGGLMGLKGIGLFGKKGIWDWVKNDKGHLKLSLNFLTQKDLDSLDALNTKLADIKAKGGDFEAQQKAIAKSMDGSSIAFRRYAVQLDGTESAMEKVKSKGVMLKSVLSGLLQSLLSMGLSAIVGSVFSFIISKISEYINRVEIAKQTTQEAVGIWEATTSELESQQKELGDVSGRLVELYKLQGTNNWTADLEQEKNQLELQNQKLQTQIDLLERKQELERQEVLTDLAEQVETEKNATRYATPWNKPVGYNHQQGQWIPDNYAYEDDYIEQATARLNELQNIYEANGRFTEAEQTQYDSIIENLTTIGQLNADRAKTAESVGASDIAKPYWEAATAANNLLDVADEIVLSTVALRTALQQTIAGSDFKSLASYKWTGSQLLSYQDGIVYQTLAETAAEYGVTVADLIPLLEDMGYLQREVGEAAADSADGLNEAAQAVGDIWAELRSGDGDNAKAIKSALGTAQDWRSTRTEVQAALKTIQNLTGIKLDIDANDLTTTLGLIESYLNGDITKFNEFATAAFNAIGVKVDPSNIEKALNDLIALMATAAGAANATAQALMGMFTGIGAIKEKKVVNQERLQKAIKGGYQGNSQGVADYFYDTTYEVDKDWLKSWSTGTKSAKSSSSSSKKQTDAKLEAYKAYIAELDHLLAMEQITEEEYYQRSLDAFNRYLGNKTKYQDQWWSLQEKYYKWWKKQAEDAANDRYEADKKAAEKAYEAEKEKLEKLKDANDDLLDAYKSRVDYQKKQLSRKGDERSYDQEVAEANKRIADLKAQIEVLSLDDSAKSKAQRLELQEELDDELLQLENKMYDRSADVQSDALDDSLDEYSRYIGAQNKLLDEQLNRLSKQHDAILDNLKSTLDATLNNISAMFQQMLAETENAVAQINSLLASIDVSSKSGIAQMQQALVNEGYNLGNYGSNKNGVDGIAGKMTVQALQEYLNNTMDAGLKVDGKVGSKTYSAMQEAVRQGILDPSFLKAFPKKYHTGGVVGKDFTSEAAFKELTKKKADEVDTRLRNGEVVLTEDQAVNAAKRLAFSSADAERLFTVMSQNLAGLFSSDGAIQQATKLAKTIANSNTTNSPYVNVVNHFHGNTDANTMRELERWSEKFKKQIKEEIFRVPINSLARTGRL